MAAPLLSLAVLAAVFTPTDATTTCSASSFIKITNSADGLIQVDPGSFFGVSVTNMGDLDGDDVNDMAAGAFYDNDRAGAVLILFMNQNGTVKTTQKIRSVTATMYGGFGFSVTNMGDLDGNGINDMAVGTYESGTVFTLLLNTHGTVVSFSEVIYTDATFYADEPTNSFGHSVTNMGDLNGDGINDMAVGDPSHVDIGTVFILLMNNNGTVNKYSKVSDGKGGLNLTTSFLQFGYSVTNLGDLNGDGINDMAVGAPGQNDGSGAVYMIFLNKSGFVKDFVEISTQGNFAGVLTSGDRFGSSVTSMGDLDGDGIYDMAVGAWRDQDGGVQKGAVYILLLNNDGTVKGHQKISDTQGNFTGVLSNNYYFGHAVTNMGDMDGDGINDMAVGAPGDGAYGAVYMINSPCTGPCINGVQDGDETGIDCGGTCAPCCTNPKIEYSGCGNLAISDVNSVTINGNEVQTSSRRERRESERIEALEAKIQAFAKKLKALESNM